MMKKLLVLAVLVFVLAQASALSDIVYVGDYEIEYSYNNVDIGDDFTLTISINNTDNVLKKDVYFELDSTNPFDVDSDDEWDIGDLDIGEKVTETFRIEVDKDAKKGTHDLEFKLEDSDDDFDDEFEIEVESDRADFLIGELNSFPDTIMPDQEDVKLEITLENIGGGDAEFVKAKLVLSEGFSTSSSFSDSTNLGTIEEGDNKIATFYFDTDANLDSGVKVAELVLEYESSGESESKILNVNLPVKGVPQFIVASVNTNPDELNLGTEDNIIRITVQNIGEETGEETSIRVFENTDMPFEFNEKTNFIGDVEPQQFGTAVFSFSLDKDFSMKEYLLKIQVRTVVNEEVLIKEYTVPITVDKAKRNSFSLIWGFAGFFIIAISMLVYLGIKVKKK